MNIVLRPNVSLLDPNFESYKLSLEKIPIYSASITSGIDINELDEDQYSIQHIKAFALHNALYQDPFNQSHVYYVNSCGELVSVILTGRNDQFDSGSSVFDIPDWESSKNDSGRHNVTLKFVSEELAVLYDGIHMMHLLTTGDRKCRTKPIWSIAVSTEPPLKTSASQLLDALLSTNENVRQVDVLLLSVTQIENNTTQCETCIDWLTYLETTPNWKMHHHRRFVAECVPEYACFEKNATALHICSSKVFYPVFDSGRPAMDANTLRKISSYANQESMEAEDGTAIESDGSSIRWSQSSAALRDDTPFNLHISLEIDCTSLSLESFRDTLTIECKAEQKVGDTDAMHYLYVTSRDARLINAALFGHVKSNLKWDIDIVSKLLHIMITKADSTVWPRVFFHETSDESKRAVAVEHNNHCLNKNIMPNIVEKIQDATQFANKMDEDKVAFKKYPGVGTAESMASIASANLLVVEEGAVDAPSFNVEQLEEVDYPMDMLENDLILQRIEADELKVSHQANLSGQQWLHNVSVVGSNPSNSLNRPCTAGICIRHDVDGILWLPEATVASIPNPSVSGIWRHASTLHAFGYVLASKRDQRFVTSPPLIADEVPGGISCASIPYVAVADASRRVYIYWQPGYKGIPAGTGDTEVRRRGTDINDSNTTGVVHVAKQQVINLNDDDPIVGFIAVEHPSHACIVATKRRLYLLSLSG